MRITSICLNNITIKTKLIIYDFDKKIKREIKRANNKRRKNRVKISKLAPFSVCGK